MHHPHRDDEAESGDQPRPAGHEAEDEGDAAQELRPDAQGRHQLGHDEIELGEELDELVHPRGAEDIVLALIDQEGAGHEAEQEQPEIAEAREPREQ